MKSFDDEILKKKLVKIDRESQGRDIGSTIESLEFDRKPNIELGPQTLRFCVKGWGIAMESLQIRTHSNSLLIHNQTILRLQILPSNITGTLF